MLTCLFEDNGKTSLRHVTVTAIVIKDDKVLLGKRGAVKDRIILEIGKWALLGGYFDRNENLKQAIQREVLEESGWTIDNLILFRINDNPDRPKEDRQNVDMLFIADAVKQTGQPDSEMTELKWYKLDNLPKREEIAFDHAENIDLYKKYKQENFSLPILG